MSLNRQPIEPPRPRCNVIAQRRPERRDLGPIRGCGDAVQIDRLRPAFEAVVGQPQLEIDAVPEFCAELGLGFEHEQQRMFEPGEIGAGNRARLRVRVRHVAEDFCRAFDALELLHREEEVLEALGRHLQHEAAAAVGARGEIDGADLYGLAVAVMEQHLLRAGQFPGGGGQRRGDRQGEADRAESCARAQPARAEPSQESGRLPSHGPHSHNCRGVRVR